MQTKTTKPSEAVTLAPTLRFSPAAEAVLGRQVDITPNGLSQITQRHLRLGRKPKPRGHRFLTDMFIQLVLSKSRSICSSQAC